jgi:hypothetical protein
MEAMEGHGFKPCRNRVLETWASALGVAAEAILECCAISPG